MESYFLMLATVFLVVLLFAVPKLITIHSQNMKMISLQRMYSRELAEALIGRRIDWDN